MQRTGRGSRHFPPATDSESFAGRENWSTTPAMGAPLYDLLPTDDEFNSDDLLGRFLEYDREHVDLGASGREASATMRG